MTRATLLILLATLCSQPQPVPTLGERGAEIPTVRERPSDIPVLASGTIVEAVNPAPLRGIATWYADRRMPQGSLYAAAGPRLRSALGSHWRGATVRVCAGRCVSVKLSDWCGCPYGRVIDLSWRAFSDPKIGLGVPLRTGVVKVSVTW